MTKFLSGSSEADRRLDRFELIAEIASGGMATVFLARLSGAGGFQRFVAIKRLHPHLSGDSEFVQMFLDEARLAARLHHPNVVPILEIGESPQGYYLVMEYVEGDTLARILARSAQAGRMLPPPVSMRVCLDAVIGLHVAHELKDDDGQPLSIVHRDVSPQNILIGMDGSARITDFGVARASTRLSTTRTGQLKGKLAYMAPEQARGQQVDRRADVFAMGIVLWECLAQKRLFKGEGEAETLNRVLYEPIPQLRQANPDVAPALAEVVMKALDRDADQRWRTASDLADALEKAARDSGALGSHKEVAAHLDSVLGTDISAQRDAVRAWLARSEPSQRFSASVPQMATPSQTTKPEGGPSTVSSVSSAVLQVPGSSASQAPMTPLAAMELPARKRSRVWLGAGAVGVLLALGGIGLFSKSVMRPPPQTGTQAPPPSPSAAPAAPAVTAAARTAAPVENTVAAAESASATRSVSSPQAGALAPAHVHTIFPKAGGHITVRPTATAAATTAPPQTTSTASPATTVDDISKNPYR